MDRTLGLVVPAYRPNVDRLAAYVAALDDRIAPDAIRIELDAPLAGTVDALAAGPATVAVSDRRRGKGAAITDGFEQLETDVLAFVDADGSTPPDSVEEVVSPVVSGAVSLAVGSRRHPAALVRSHQTLVRRRLGDLLAVVARGILPVKLYDYQCGAKAISADAWRQVRSHLYEPGFAWDIELVTMAWALDVSIAEIPIVWEDQPGTTVATLGTSLALGRTLLLARHRAKLVTDDPLHAALNRYRGARPALVERPGAGR